jgi:hypothetical protein
LPSVIRERAIAELGSVLMFRAVSFRRLGYKGNDEKYK